jgi:glycosyltransferase involved in cell wall biosynthesis
MSLPLCTIVIPAYNAGIWIERTLRSAAQQSYPNLEILVIDDGSKDNTRMLAEAMVRVDNRFRVISIPNGGVANARNVGIHEACGKYVAFLDADDLWHPDKIRLQVEAMQRLADGRMPAASYTLMRSIDVHDRVIDDGGSPSAGASGHILARHLYFKFVGNGSSVLVCRDVALELGGYDPSWASRGIGGCEDLDFELKVAARYPIACVPQLLVGHRRSPGNMSSNGLQMGRGILGVIKQHLMANPQIPRWATRLIYASTLDLSFGFLVGGRHWRDALEHLGLMFMNRPQQAISVAMKRLRNQAKRMPFLRRNAEEELASRPLFAEISPKIDLAQCEAWLRSNAKIREALTALDAEHWREIIQNQHSVAGGSDTG